VTGDSTGPARSVGPTPPSVGSVNCVKVVGLDTTVVL
jgi:hypothetical protein